MNDTELDEILDQWTAPEPTAALRNNVRAGLKPAVKRRPFGGWLWRASALAGVAIVLLVVGRAFPQVLRIGPPPVRPPFTMDSESIVYDEHGGPSVDMYMTSYADNGHEFVLSRSIPGDPLTVALWQTWDGFRQAVSRATMPFTISDDQMKRLRELRKNDVGFAIGLSSHFFRPERSTENCIAGPAAGRETILNYPTTAFYAPVILQHRVTLWLAPDLGCIALRVTLEAPQPDGSFRLIGKKQALKVSRKPLRFFPCVATLSIARVRYRAKERSAAPFCRHAEAGHGVRRHQVVQRGTARSPKSEGRPARRDSRR